MFSKRLVLSPDRSVTSARVVKITTVESGSKKLAVPSALSTDGSSFSVAWKAEK